MALAETRFSTLQFGSSERLKNESGWPHRWLQQHNPAHPGEMLAGWLDELDINAAAFADRSGIQLALLSRVLQGKAAVSVEVDLSLSKTLGTSAGYWLALQAGHDAWATRHLSGAKK